MTIKEQTSNKLFLGFVVAAVSAALGSSGYAVAAHVNSHWNVAAITKEQCKNGGFRALGYRNQGRCVNVAARSANGVGYGGQSAPLIRAMVAFDDRYTTAQTTFEESVHTTVAQTKSELSSKNQVVADDFNSQFASASNTFDDAVQTAEAEFISTVTTAANSGMSKDQFMNVFNSAKDVYFNRLNEAKDRFSDQLNRMGGSNEAKDRFNNKFNSLKDRHGNQLNEMKDRLSDELNNPR